MMNIQQSAAMPHLAAVKPLQAAIDLHGKHMDGTAPVAGHKGMASQQKVMDLMQEAMGHVKGPPGGLLGAAPK